jgi:outer membrane protein assembly factor BamB
MARVRSVCAVLGAVVIGIGAVVLVGACPPLGTLPGCGKDIDCKGARICVAGACVDPAPRAPAPPAAIVDGGDVVAASDGGEGSAAPCSVAPTDLGVNLTAGLGPAPMFHVDAQHAGRSAARAPVALPHETMHVATGGVVVSQPAIATTPDGPLLVFGSHDKSVYAVAADGTIRWRRATGDLVWCAPALGPDGVVYVGSDDDKLYAFDLKDGSTRWSFQAGPCRVAVGSGPEAARCDVDGVTVAPDGAIFASADGLYALRPDGTLRWKFQPGPRVHCAAPPAVSLDGTTVYVGCQDDGLYAIDAATGTKRWEIRAGGDVDSAPAVGADGTIYVGSDDKKLYAIAPGGGLRWAVITGGAIRSSPAIGGDGTVYVGSGDGNLYAVRPGGVVAWTFRAADRILGSPVIDAAGTVLVGSQDDRLYALFADGKLAWSVLLDGDVDGTPALGSDGTIYIGTDDRALHALR